MYNENVYYIDDNISLGLALINHYKFIAEVLFILRNNFFVLLLLFA